MTLSIQDYFVKNTITMPLSFGNVISCHCIAQLLAKPVVPCCRETNLNPPWLTWPEQYTGDWRGGWGRGGDLQKNKGNKTTGKDIIDA